MRSNLLLDQTLAFFCCFIVNVISHQDLLVSLTNSLTLIFSINFFKEYIKKISLFTSLFLISLGLMPIFTYHPVNTYLSFLPIISLILINFYKGKPSKLKLAIIAIVLFISNLYVGEVIKFPISIQHTQLIFNSPEIRYNIKRHQADALYIPFKIRQLVYSEIIFVYASLSNFFNFLTLKGLVDVLLIANIYPLILGLYKTFKEKAFFRNLCIVYFLITFLVSSIDRSPDRFQSLYLLTPIFIYLMLFGFKLIHKKIYIFLFAISIFILISPKI